MSSRHVRGTAVAGLLGAALACTALTGCGSVVAATQAAAPATPPAPAVGCASVNQATSVTIRRTMHLVEPTRVGGLNRTQSKPALVRALFGDFCNALAHADKAKGTVHCPAAFGIAYTGTFYDGRRTLAKFVYGASGCQTVSITAGGKTRSAMVFGTASAAAPHLEADMAAVLGLPKSTVFMPSGQVVNPGGGPAKLRQVARLVEVELAVLDPENERIPLGLGEVELVAVGVGRVVHDVQLGLIGLVRRGRGVGGDVHLDPALFSINRGSVVTLCVHGPRVLP